VAGSSQEKDEGLSASEITEGKRLLHKARTKGIQGLGQREFELVVSKSRQHLPLTSSTSMDSTIELEERDLELSSDSKDLNHLTTIPLDSDPSYTPFLPTSNASI